MDKTDTVRRFLLAVEQVEAAKEQRGLTELRCSNPDCERVVAEYIAPVGYLLVRCRRCGLYSELTTEH